MRIDVPITESFIAYDSYNNAISGLTFSYSVYQNGNTSSVSALITEINPSVYLLNFTPSQTGHWLIEMTSASAVFNATYFIDSHDTDQIYPFVSDIWKIETGKWIISGNQLKLYDGNSNTILFTFNLYDGGGLPSMTGVSTRIPA